MTLSTPMSEIVPVLRPSVNNLDSLVTFYQQERMWVYRTRVELQDVEDEDEHSPPLPNSPPSPSISHEPPIRPSRRSSSPTRWTRRKKGLKLNSSSSRRSLQTSMDAAHNPAIRVLDMYESIMQSRMESCERINRLIRNANRTHVSRVPKRSHYAERRKSDYSSDEYQ
ncbi:hypothetical protein BDZ89DRAFT_766330 [Hymenopellis radicata]|nr:hypothetical protein BDZ89DRAFT_766330 [Hymenopellis radicata]